MRMRIIICKFAQTYLDRVRSLCVPWRHKKSQRRACIDSRMLSTTVARPSTSYQQETASSILIIAYVQLAEVCTLVLFIMWGTPQTCVCTETAAHVVVWTLILDH